MQHPLISAPDKKDLDKFTKFLCLKAAQVIVQGRLGKSISSQCRPTPTGAEWFNLAIKDYPEIQKEAKSALLEGNPNFISSFVVEISLRTSDSRSLTLEIWSLSNMKKFEDVRIHHTVYNRMSLLLKSLMCVSRATPAYKLSRKQGSEYVICFRVYSGKADISGLGEGSKTLRVGSIGTPTGTLTLSVAFRTSENLHVSTKKLAPGSGGQMKVSPDHFCTPRDKAMSPARPCHTLRSRLMNSKDFSGGSQSSSGPLDSPSYTMLPTSFSTSPSDVYLETSRQKSAIFTVGTPPTVGSIGKTSPSPSPSPLPPGVRRKTSEERLLPRTSRRNFVHSQSEQNFSDPMQYHDRHGRRRRTIQEEIFYKQKVYEEDDRIHSSVPKETSMHSTLTNEDAVFRPISCSPVDRHHSSPNRSSTRSLTRSNRRKSSHIDTVLKSNSPTNARVGFPDNTETTSHLSHIPPALVSTKTSYSTRVSDSQRGLYMPSPGAFVSNSKTAKTAYNTLKEISNEQSLPFRDLLISDDSSETHRESLERSKSKESRDNSSSDTSPESIRQNTSMLTKSSHSSLDSQPSSESSPRKDTITDPRPPIDEFLMIDLNPAFGKSDSSKDLCAFYREIENAPDLIIFQENNGRETQDTLLDLTKQLEDYHPDAEDFDEFMKELEAAS